MVLEVIRAPAWKERIAAVLAFGLVLAAAYTYFVRPLVESSRTYYYWYSGATLRTYDAENLVRIGWYLSPVGIFLSVCGAALLVARRLSSRTVFTLTGGLLFTALYVWNIANNPLQVYAMRRYVPVVMPLLSLFIAYALNIAWRKWGFALLGKLAVAGAAIFVIGYMLIARSLLYTVIEYDGVALQTVRLVAELPANSVTIFTNTGLGNLFATPLTYIYGRDAFSLQQEQPDAGRLSAAIEAWRTHGREVYWIVDSEKALEPPLDYVAIRAGEFVIDVPTLEQSYEHPPAQVLRLRANMSVYRLTPSRELRDSNPAGLIEIGAADLGVFGDGFYPVETGSNGVRFRWISDRASLNTAYTSLAVGKHVTLLLSGWRPEGAPAAYLRVFAGDVLLGGWPIPSDAVNREYTLAVDPPPNAARLRLEVTPPWTPRVSGLADDRVLGVAVSSIRIDP